MTRARTLSALALCDGLQPASQRPTAAQHQRTVATPRTATVTAIIDGRRVRGTQDEIAAKRREANERREERDADVRARHAAEREARATREAGVRARAGELRELAKQRDFAGLPLSALVCESQRGLQEAQAELREQKRINRLSGTVRPADLRSAVELVEEWKAHLRKYRKYLRETGGVQQACGSEAHARLFRCVERLSVYATPEQRRAAALGLPEPESKEEALARQRCDDPSGTQAEIYKQRHELFP